ncbi:AarF/ABC1/UbiB kinase family protein [Prochlorococcus sp. MIT 1300]|uniref:ABC1 kinase family protein n=1 Tax=Prochlorococcus sp. MIT 1300 TaxID=3096218 RepID=UPI002A75F115|nr:AarF/ABC1/UbiB kinase family protein [Prochlorococcus sp. MIT 1300]
MKYFPKSTISRGVRIFLIWHGVIKLILIIWFDTQKWTYPGGWTAERFKARQKKSAQWLAKKLIYLGSAFIKLGQLLSARPDVLPANWVIELADLQDKVPPFKFETAEKVLRRELGPRYAEIIDIERHPLGAASLAQVHRARLRSGRQVVLKIQRPGLQKLFKLDLEVMQKVAALLQRHPEWGKGRDWIGIAKECRRVLMKELDFQIEAQYAARFRQQFFDNPKVSIPGVIWELSTREVLCLDYLPGIKINDRESLIKAGINPSDIAKIGTSSYLQQLVRFGFFHADPHPGNLAVAADGSLIYYDFGMMGLISDGLKSRIGSMVRAAAIKDASALVKEFQAVGLIASEVDVGPVRRLIRVMLQEALTPPFKADILEKLSGDLYDLVYGKPFRIPVELIFVMRAMTTFEGVGRTLDPSFNLMAIAQPYLIPLMTSSNSSPNDLINELGRQVGAIGSRAVALPKRLDESLERLEQGDLQLQIRMGESDRHLRRIANAQQFVGQSIILGALSVTAAILGSGERPIWALVPIAFSLPAILSWLKLQMRIKSDDRIPRVGSENI